MSTPHNKAKKGEIAESILLVGDPLRAKYIAENFLNDAKCYNEVRGMYGFTGTYNGKRVSVQSVGMGVPSMLIYATELINEYGAKRLVRAGTCGSIDENLNIKDLLIAKKVRTDSNVIRTIYGDNKELGCNEKLLEEAIKKAQERGIEAKQSKIYTSDFFYDSPLTTKELQDMGLQALEMETAALYHLGEKYNVEVLSLLTVSDNILTKERATTEERQKTFNNMIELGLEIL